MTPATLSREERTQVQSYLERDLSGPVSIELWTRKDSALVRPDRDPCTHCEDVIAIARQLAGLHPGLSVTLYDLDRHAQRAQEARIDRPPVTVFRGRYGREFRVTGLWSGLLFPQTVDAVLLLGAGATPLSDQIKTQLAALSEDVMLEVLGAPYDAYSAHMLRLAAAFAVESKRIRASFVELAEFPILAATRGVDEVPVMLINGQRFVGTWDGPELSEQIARLTSGDTSPVTRANMFSAPFYTHEEIERLAEQGRQDEPPPPAGGLYVPGR